MIHSEQQEFTLTFSSVCRLRWGEFASAGGMPIEFLVGPLDGAEPV